MSVKSVLSRVPPAAWAGAAIVGLWWWLQPRPADGSPVAGGDEDLRTVPPSDAGLFNPAGAHVAGLPYVLGHLHPAHKGRSKYYPASVLGQVLSCSAYDPQDETAYPWLTYGGHC
jgi:hypothetical protein